jgi:phosphoribosyl-AMP cyclohydrolase / phosphoribosyl-ATP pyrophosphohydrolase
MIDINKINFNKLGGLVPAVIIDNKNDQVLMVGFMNWESLTKTIETGLVTFFSRSRNALWTKGETSKNYLKLIDIKSDCDNDSLLVYALPEGPTCHRGTYSCFEGIEEKTSKYFLHELYNLIKSRKDELPEGSYTARLFNEGENRIIQKVGEEAVETIIAAKNHDKIEIINEASDLVYHLLVMLADQNIELEEIISNLKSRHKK